MIEQVPSRGDIWLADLDPVRGHEQAGRRPCLVMSVDEFDHGPAGLAVVVPLTSRLYRNVFHVEVKPPEGGLNQPSCIKCEDVRSLSQERFVRRWGVVLPITMDQVEYRLRLLLGL